MEYPEEIFSPLQWQLLRLLKEKGPMTRNEIVKQVQAPRTTVYDNLTRLQYHEQVQKYSYPNNRKGRPKVYFHYVGDILDEN